MCTDSLAAYAILPPGGPRYNVTLAANVRADRKLQGMAGDVLRLMHSSLLLEISGWNDDPTVGRVVFTVPNAVALPVLSIVLPDEIQWVSIMTSVANTRVAIWLKSDEPKWNPSMAIAK